MPATANRYTAAYDAQRALKALIEGLGIEGLPVFLGWPNGTAPSDCVVIAGNVPELSKAQDQSGAVGRGQVENFEVDTVWMWMGAGQDFEQVMDIADAVIIAFRLALLADPTLGGCVDWARISSHMTQETKAEQSQRGVDIAIKVAYQAYIN